MNKTLGVVIVGLALVIGIVPLFTDCLSQGRMLTTTAGTTVPMKCHWTAIAEIGMSIPLLLVGLYNIFGKRKETLQAMNLFGLVLGTLVILFPTLLIGVCAKPDMICNMIMRPTLLLAGTLTILSSLVVETKAVRMVENAA